MSDMDRGGQKADKRKMAAQTEVVRERINKKKMITQAGTGGKQRNAEPEKAGKKDGTAGQSKNRKRTK